MSDPFELLKDTLSTSRKLLSMDLENLKSMTVSDSLDSNVEFLALVEDIEKKSAEFKKKIDKGQQVLKSIKSNRKNFGTIGDAEIVKRDGWLREMAQFDKSVKVAISEPDVVSKLRIVRKKMNDIKNKTSAQPDLGATAKADPLMENMEQSMQMIRKNEDIALGDISILLKQIKEKGEEMETELGDQSKIMGRMNDKADTINNQAKIVVDKLKDLLGTNDGWKLCTLGVLLIILIMLLIVVFYT